MSLSTEQLKECQDILNDAQSLEKDCGPGYHTGEFVVTPTEGVIAFLKDHGCSEIEQDPEYPEFISFALSK